MGEGGRKWLNDGGLGGGVAEEWWMWKEIAAFAAKTVCLEAAGRHVHLLAGGLLQLNGFHRVWVLGTGCK